MRSLQAPRLNMKLRQRWRCLFILRVAHLYEGHGFSVGEFAFETVPMSGLYAYTQRQMLEGEVNTPVHDVIHPHAAKSISGDGEEWQKFNILCLG